MWRDEYAKFQKLFIEYAEWVVGVILLILVLRIGYIFATLGFEEFIERLMFLLCALASGMGIEFLYRFHAPRTMR